MPDTEVITPLPHPVLTSLCRLIGDRLGADLVLITSQDHTILASHSWPLNLKVAPLEALMTADMLILNDTTQDPRFEPLAEAMGGFRTGFYAAARLRESDGNVLGYLYLLRHLPRTFERQHYQAFLDSICLASDYLVQYRALRRSVQIEARLLPFESGVESMTDAVLVYSQAGQIIYADRAAEQLFGAPVKDLEGQRLTTLIPGGPEALPQANTGHWGLGHAEGRTLGGLALQLDVASRQLEVDNTNFTLLVRDVSKNHENVLALTRSQLHTQALLQAIPDSLFVVSKEGVVLSYKPDSLEFNRDPVGRSLYAIWSSAAGEQLMLMLRLTLHNGRRSRPFSIETPVGSAVLELEARFTPMGSEWALLVVRNVTLEGHLSLETPPENDPDQLKPFEHQLGEDHDSRN